MNKDEALRLLNGHNLTSFQLDVLVATAKIPKGEVRSYKQVARMSGHPGAYRAVGTALRLNPVPIKIPCHRVIKSSGDLGSYAGRPNSRRKERLLRMEGAV